MKRAFAVAAGWALVAAVVWLSLMPSPPQVDLAQSDKLGHLAAYGLLMLWFALLYRTRLYYALGFIAMGAALELIQGSLGYRTADPLDAAANTLGVLLGWGVALILPRPLLR